jgi:hypothetical protein
VELIANLSEPKVVKDIRAFLGHVGFYKKFIKDFNRIARPLTNLLKDVPFIFDDSCKEAFNNIKAYLTSTPIVQAPNWDYSFELMCDASE